MRIHISIKIPINHRTRIHFCLSCTSRYFFLMLRGTSKQKVDGPSGAESFSLQEDFLLLLMDMGKRR